MSYIRKTYDVYELVTDYGYGPEAECTYNTRKEAYEDWKTYMNEKKAGYLPQLISCTIRTRRVRKENM